MGLEYLRLKLFLYLNGIANLTAHHLTQKSFNLEDSLHLNRKIKKANDYLIRLFTDTQNRENSPYDYESRHSQDMQSTSQVDSVIESYCPKDTFSQFTENAIDHRVN